MGEITTALLDRRLYTIRDASAVLDVPPSTLTWWLHGRVSGDRVHLPVLRQEVNSDKHVTWGELIEASLLKQLRARDVKLDAIRTFARGVRLGRGWEYPLARHDLYVGEGQKLLYEAQQLAGLEEGQVLLVASPDYGEGQRVLGEGTGVLDAFFEPIEFENNLPTVYHPDPDVWEVACEPVVRFGVPQVRGVPTEALWELYLAGGRSQGIADDFDLPVDVVEAAIRFEQRRSDVDRAA